MTPVLDMVILPLPFVIPMPVEGVMLERVYPLPFPMRSCPLVGEVVNPVPPLLTFNVPESVTAPEDGVDGVKPVVPALKDDTPTVPVAEMVILPGPLAIVTPDPAVSVESVGGFDVLPIRS